MFKSDKNTIKINLLTMYEDKSRAFLTYRTHLRVFNRLVYLLALNRPRINENSHNTLQQQNVEKKGPL